MGGSFPPRTFINPPDCFQKSDRYFLGIVVVRVVRPTQIYAERIYSFCLPRARYIRMYVCVCVCEPELFSYRFDDDSYFLGIRHVDGYIPV